MKDISITIIKYQLLHSLKCIFFIIFLNFFIMAGMRTSRQTCSITLLSWRKHLLQNRVTKVHQAINLYLKSKMRMIVTQIHCWTVKRIMRKRIGHFSVATRNSDPTAWTPGVVYKSSNAFWREHQGRAIGTCGWTSTNWVSWPQNMRHQCNHNKSSALFVHLSLI